MATVPQWEVIGSTFNKYGSDWIDLKRTDEGASTFSKKEAHISKEQIAAILSVMTVEDLHTFAGVEVKHDEFQVKGDAPTV